METTYINQTEKDMSGHPVDRLKLLYPNVDEKLTPLPRSWSSQEKCNSIGLTQNNLRVHYKGFYTHNLYISFENWIFFFVSVRYCVFFLLLPCISIVHFLCRFCYKYNNNIIFFAVLVFVGFVCSDHIIWWDVCHIPCIYKSIKKKSPCEYASNAK